MRIQSSTPKLALKSFAVFTSVVLIMFGLGYLVGKGLYYLFN